MVRRLPPLNALRAFEAAGRHLSFTNAARELGVTPAAVIHHVNNLEETLGLALFRRSNRGLALTDVGRNCLDGFGAGFDKLAETIERATTGAPDRFLSINTMPCFAALWLMPRLSTFEQAYPNLNLRVAAVQQTRGANLEADVTIRYRPGPYPGCHVERLAEEEVFPVCSPALADQAPPLRTPGDLRHRPLIHDEWLRIYETFPDWRAWLDAADARDVDASRGLRVNVTALAMAEARAGHGVALGRSLLVQDDLANGSLVRPFDAVYPVSFTYYVIWPKKAATQKRVNNFVEWLFAAVKSGPRRPSPAAMQ